MKLPQEVCNKIIKMLGSRGSRWLEQLPNLISDCQKKWSLSQLELVGNLSFNCIFRAMRKDDLFPVILKLSIPGHEFEHEIRTLQIYDGVGAVKLLDFDLNKRACLLRALVPGNSLQSLFPEEDEKAALITIEVMNKLHSHKIPVESVNNFPTIGGWLSTLDNLNLDNLKELYFSDLIAKAKPIASHLLETQKSVVLLHGDLHHDNILLNKKEWTSIDPKGVIGEPEYEIGAFIRNPIEQLLQQPDPLHIINKRLDIFSTELKLDKLRLTQWCFVQSVLAACWAYEDKENWNIWIKMAEFCLKLELN